ncbi:hypothetical protein [Lacticaseibacillus chiayiensis]|uniref:hypothetical protein n=1 Tax=Lacticaseibacillus chiayiensis TaxID=2100821 RepID=UPI0010110D0A|nr:hypothetical protein [Lacticaseibacillus chiayiensis]RXT57811.1 hypothetical protein CHT97_10100 [Lacticaseibacillus chiayiensis]
MSYPEFSPQVMANFNKYWPKFIKRKQYQELKLPREAVEVVAVIIQQYLDGMNNRIGLNPAKWSAQDIQQNMQDIIDQAPQDTLGVTIASTSFLAIQQFLKWLAATGALRVSQSKIDQIMLPMMMDLIVTLSKVEAESDDNSELDGTIMDDDFDDLASDVKLGFANAADRGVVDPTLPEWQEETSDRIQEEVASLFDEFADNEDVLHALPENISPDDAWTYVSMLVEKVYDQFRKTPKTWTGKAVSDVMTGYFVTNLSIPKEEYENIGPALTLFVDYMTKRHYIRPVVGKRVNEAINEAAPKMVTLAQDPGNYGPAKKFGLALKKAGVDPTDSDAFEAFQDKYNEIEQTKRAAQGLFYRKEFVYEPDEAYRSEQHVEEIGDRHWHLATATRNHNQVLKFIRLTWTAEDNQALRDAYSQELVVNEVVTMGDALYAQYLETPKNWEPEHFYSCLTEMIKQQPVFQSRALVASLTELLTYLIQNKKIARKRGNKLLIMVAEGGALLPKPAKPKGRTISLSDYKRGKRKNKKRRKKR